MPKKKLTLSVDETVISRAKRFSRRHGTTVSALVTDFLADLEDGEEAAAPITTRLRGVLPSTTTRDEYRRHLDEKHE